MRKLRSQAGMTSRCRELEVAARGEEGRLAEFGS